MRHLRNLAARDQRYDRYASFVQPTTVRVLTAVKRGNSSQLPLPTVKVEGTPLPMVKTEVSSNPTDSGNCGREELDPSSGQGITGCDETDSDTASAVDDEYSHTRVCDSF